MAILLKNKEIKNLVIRFFIFLLLKKTDHIDII